MRNCAFAGCSNGDWKIRRWEKDNCEIHGCKHGLGACVCTPPVRLFTFPTVLRDEEARRRWAKLVNRKVTKSGKNWQPSKDSRVCSCHFPDGEPTQENPDPVLNLGYDVPKKAAPRRSLPTRGPPLVKKRKVEKPVDPLQDHMGYHYTCDCCDNCACPGCVTKQCEIMQLKSDIDYLMFEMDTLQEQVKVDRKQKSVFNSAMMKTDKQTRDLTGLPSKNAFEKVYEHVEPVAKKLRYWRGEKKEKSRSNTTRKFSAKSPKRQGRKRKMELKEEFFLVMLKLRLALTMSFLSILFGVGVSTCSEIFNTWVKFLATELAPLIFWPDRDLIRQCQPQQIKLTCKSLRAIIDCTEIFIERPRHLRLQALTWSDYKKHNTAKLLIAIAPNGMISFVSKVWGGRASDRHIVQKSGILQLLDAGDTLMADRGFPIQSDLLLQQCSLQIPPSSSGQNQMTKSKVEQTKKVANIRIHVERAIGRVKWFHILKNTLPITLIPLIDDIVMVCCALSNLRPPLVSKLES